MGGIDDYDAATYGERFADIYDAWVVGIAETDPVVTLLAELVDGRSTLEMGIGTGRIALPLARRGITVQGIAAEAAMVARSGRRKGPRAYRSPAATSPTSRWRGASGSSSSSSIVSSESAA